MGGQKETVGTLEVRVSVINIDGPQISSVIQQATQQIPTMHYNNVWEQNLVMRIAKKVARLPGDVETLFGAFSRGQKTVTKEDFKYTVLKRLQLSKEINEREIDMFLRGNPRLLDREIINLEDFQMIFSAAITQARHDLLDEEALGNATIKRYQMETMSKFVKNDFENSFGVNEPMNQMTSKEADVLEILASIRNYQGQKSVTDRLREISYNNAVT